MTTHLCIQPKIKKINEYKTFLRVKNFYTLGLNHYSINNLNYDNFIGYNYFALLNNKKIIVRHNNYINLINNNNNKVSAFKKLIKFSKWSSSKTILPKYLFNSYFKKTFFKSFENQDVFSKDNFDKINYRLEGLPKNNILRLQKFKPYTLKSISKVNRYRFNESILTK